MRSSTAGLGLKLLLAWRASFVLARWAMDSRPLRRRRRARVRALPCSVVEELYELTCRSHHFLVSDAAASEFVTAKRAAALGLVNELGDPAEVESRAVEKAHAMAAIPSRGFAISKRMRTERLCATIRGEFPAQLKQFLDTWFGEEAQRLRATADQIRRPSA